MAVDEKLIKGMFDNAVYIGHRTERWNPKVKKWLYGEQSGVHLINLEKTAVCLEKALAFMSKMVSEGKVILFVSTKSQSIHLVENLADSCHMPYVVSKWIPGLITNFVTVKKRIKYLLDLKQRAAAGEFAKYTKKEASGLKKIIEKLQAALGGVEKLTSVPDAVFVVDVVKDAIVVKEASKLKIPVVAIIDTNADPEFVDYPIPANDDALKSLSFIFKKITEAFKSHVK